MQKLIYVLIYIFTEQTRGNMESICLYDKKGKLLLACRAGVLLRASEFHQRKLWPPSLIEMTAEGRGEKKISTKGAVDGQKNKERGGVGE